jgi:hypothetical protein
LGIKTVHDFERFSQQAPDSLRPTMLARLHCCCCQVPPAVSDSEDRRKGVSEVELLFALPTTADGSAAPDTGAQLFAFLPVASYGFRCGAVAAVMHAADIDVMGCFEGCFCAVAAAEVV